MTADKETCVIQYVSSSVPLDTAFKACGVSPSEAKTMDSDKIEAAEAKAYADLIIRQHSLAMEGDNRALAELLVKRYSIDSSSQAKIISNLLTVAESVLPPEWFDKLLAAIADS